MIYYVERQMVRVGDDGINLERIFLSVTDDKGAVWALTLIENHSPVIDACWPIYQELVWLANLGAHAERTSKQVRAAMGSAFGAPDSLRRRESEPIPPPYSASDFEFTVKANENLRQMEENLRRGQEAIERQSREKRCSCPCHSLLNPGPCHGDGKGGNCC